MPRDLIYCCGVRKCWSSRSKYKRAGKIKTYYGCVSEKGLVFVELKMEVELEKIWITIHKVGTEWAVLLTFIVFVLRSSSIGTYALWMLAITLFHTTLLTVVLNKYTVVISAYCLIFFSHDVLRPLEFFCLLSCFAKLVESVGPPHYASITCVYGIFLIYTLRITWHGGKEHISKTSLVSTFSRLDVASVKNKLLSIW